MPPANRAIADGYRQRPADLPVFQSIKSSWSSIYDLRKRLGIEIPDRLLSLADGVIG